MRERTTAGVTPRSAEWLNGIAPRPEQGWWSMGADSPDLVVAMLLLNHLKLHGFQFQRAAPGEDGPLVGNRVTEQHGQLALPCRYRAGRACRRSPMIVVQARYRPFCALALASHWEPSRSSVRA